MIEFLKQVSEVSTSKYMIYHANSKFTHLIGWFHQEIDKKQVK